MERESMDYKFYLLNFCERETWFVTLLDTILEYVKI